MVPLTAAETPKGGGKGGAADDRTVKRYDGRVVGMHWAFIITFLPLFYTGLLMFRDWFVEEFHIHGVDPYLPSFSGMTELHWQLGVAVLLVGLVHVLLHIGQKEKPILPKNVGVDLGASIHNILYIFHMVARQERGAGDKYLGNQRMTYVAFAYLLLLSGITALIMWLDVIGELGVLMHVTAGVLVIFLSLYRILTLIRRHDAIASKCILATGRMPLWYVKKNHFLWYRQLKGGYKAPKDPQYEKLAASVQEDQPEVVKA